MIRVFLVDNLSSTRRGLRLRLEPERDVTVVGEASTGAEALRLVPRLGPDVVVMDVALPGVNGIAATVALGALAPGSAVVILSLRDDAETRARAQTAGARAFVSKHQPGAMLLAAIRRAASRVRSP